MNWKKNFKKYSNEEYEIELDGLLFLVARFTRHSDFDNPDNLEIIENTEEFDSPNQPDELVLNFSAN